MTVIVYDGKNKTISADTMASSKTSSIETKLEAVFKITDLVKDDLVFGDEKLLAFTAAGNVAAMKAMFDFTVRNFREWEGFGDMVNRNGFNYDAFGNGTVMLVTSKSVHHLDFHRNGFVYKKVELDGYLAIGSGALPATTAMRVFGLSGHDAVVAAGITVPSCGLLVTTYDIAEDGLKVRHPKSYENSMETLLELRKKAGNSTDLHGEELTPHSGALIKYNAKEVKKELENAWKRAEERRAKKKASEKEEEAEVKTKPEVPVTTIVTDPPVVKEEGDKKVTKKAKDKPTKQAKKPAVKKEKKTAGTQKARTPKKPASGVEVI